MTQLGKFDKCDICVTDKILCDQCRDNPKYRNVPKQSLFTDYKPVCPLGMVDCVRDPAYVKQYCSEWYKSLYGDIPPEEAVKQHCSQYSDPSECYDDEDK